MPDDHPPSDYAGMTPSRTDYTVAKGEVSLAVYRKGLDRAPRPVLFLAHGSSNSPLSSFDLEGGLPSPPCELGHSQFCSRDAI